MTERYVALPQIVSETPSSHWFLDSDTYHEFSAQLAGRSVHRISEGRVETLNSMSIRSTGLRSSTPVRVRPQMSVFSSAPSTTATESVPHLTRGPSTVSSIRSSADTSAASVLDGGYVLSVQDDGILTLPERVMLPNADLLCPFQILDCEDIFSDIREFKTHVFSHFRGHPAPTTAGCFLCDETFHQTDTDLPALAWNKMLSHLANDHYRQGQRSATIRTDFYLMKWMYSKRIITDAQFKSTQLCPVPIVLPNPANEGSGTFPNTPFAPMPPSAPPPTAIRSAGSTSVGEQTEPFTMQAGRRAERRRRDATRMMHGRGNL
jgi:hypothetical protein